MIKITIPLLFLAYAAGQNTDPIYPTEFLGLWRPINNSDFTPYFKHISPVNDGRGNSILIKRPNKDLISFGEEHKLILDHSLQPYCNMEIPGVIRAYVQNDEIIIDWYRSKEYQERMKLVNGKLLVQNDMYAGRHTLYEKVTLSPVPR